MCTVILSQRNTQDIVKPESQNASITIYTVSYRHKWFLVTTILVTFPVQHFIVFLIIKIKIYYKLFFYRYLTLLNYLLLSLSSKNNNIKGWDMIHVHLSYLRRFANHNRLRKNRVIYLISLYWNDLSLLIKHSKVVHLYFKSTEQSWFLTKFKI